MAKANSSPLERDEQITFVQYLEARGLLFTATAQSTYSTSWNQKRLNKATGVRKGFPDMVVVISPEQSKDGLGYMLAIELKRVKGGVVSKEQKVWHESINALKTPQVQAYIAKGSSEAIKVVEHYIKPDLIAFKEF